MKFKWESGFNSWLTDDSRGLSASKRETYYALRFTRRLLPTPPAVAEQTKSAYAEQREGGGFLDDATCLISA